MRFPGRIWRVLRLDASVYREVARDGATTRQAFLIYVLPAIVLAMAALSDPEAPPITDFGVAVLLVPVLAIFWTSSVQWIGVRVVARPSPYGSLFRSVGFAATASVPGPCGGSGTVAIGAIGWGGLPRVDHPSCVARHQPDPRHQEVVRMPNRRGDPNPGGNSRSGNSYPNIPLTHHPVLLPQIPLPPVQKARRSGPKRNGPVSIDLETAGYAASALSSRYSATRVGVTGLEPVTSRM